MHDRSRWERRSENVLIRRGEKIEAYCNRGVALSSGMPGVLISVRTRLALRFSRAGKAAVERFWLTV